MVDENGFINKDCIEIKVKYGSPQEDLNNKNLDYQDLNIKIKYANDIAVFEQYYQ